MDSSVLIVSVLVGVYLIANLCFVPMQIRYLEAKKEEKKEEPDVNKRHENQSFEESQMEYNQQGGILAPSLWIAGIILYFRKRKEE